MDTPPNEPVNESAATQGDAPSSYPMPPAPVATPTAPLPPPPRPDWEQKVEHTPLRLKEDRLTFGKVIRFLFTLVLVIALPLFATVALGTYQLMRPSEKKHSSVTPQSEGVQGENVLLTTADGLTLTAWYVPAQNPPPDDAAAILVLHGYPTDKGDILPRAKFLAKNYDLLLVDFRSFGGSSGDYTTLGPKETLDALAGIDWLASRGKTRIGIYGYSMGGAVALMTIPETGKVSAIATEGAYADVREMAERPYEILGPGKVVCGWLVSQAAKYWLHIDLDRQTPRVAVNGTKMPLLVMHAIGDEAVPFSQEQELQAAIGPDPNAEFATVSPGDEDADRAFVKKMNEFFKKWLSPPEAPAAPSSDAATTDDHKEFNPKVSPADTITYPQPASIQPLH